MTFFFGDGFDCYRDITDCGTYWDATLGSASLAISASGRFAGSRGVTLVTSFNAAHITKTSNVNDAVHHLSVAFQQTVALSGTASGLWFTFYDGATAQCTIVFRGDGAILLVSGTVLGTTLATYAGAVAASNIWYQFEIEVIVSNTVGGMRVRRNGNTSNDFDSFISVGNLNTRSSANNYANKIGMGCSWNNTGAHICDDFLWRSDASSVAWIGDVRCYTRMPAGDSAVQFTRSGSVVPVTPFAQGGTVVVSNTQQRYTPFIATCDGTIGSVILSMALGYTGNMKCSLFTNSGTNTPAAVLGSATVVNNPATGNNTFTFGTPVAVTRGGNYWVGFAADTSSGNINSSTTGLSSGPYASTGVAGNGSVSYAAFPTASPSLTLTQSAAICTLNITPTTASNANLVAEVAQDAAGGYVLSSTNGQADLYTLAATPSTPAVVIGVTTRGLFQKSDAGTRNATVQLKSGGVTVAGTSTALPVGSWQWIARNDLVDPATSAAWTASGVNAALVGPAVTA